MMRARALLLLALLVALREQAKSFQAEMTVKGEVVAYRNAEWFLQMPSFAQNKESFLFRITEQRQPTLVKVVYEHVGQSDLRPELLAKPPTLQLTLVRDPACDETFGSFLRNAPSIREAGSGKETIGGVSFLGDFQKNAPPTDSKLTCYNLRSGWFKFH